LNTVVLEKISFLNGSREDEYLEEEEEEEEAEAEADFSRKDTV
jgi:hypothetical protein